MAALGIDDVVHLVNHSSSIKGVLRGLHFQYAPKGMSKLIRCTRGRLFDVTVDLRKDSPSFKQWVGVELTAENDKMLYLPGGCAHGFYALEDCEILYATGENYELAFDANVRWNDPEFGVAWPLDGEPIISERDKKAPLLSEILGHLNHEYVEKNIPESKE
jgi:dTDP-4-dehydrorhamnose 3,5-epimerase